VLSRSVRHTLPKDGGALTPHAPSRGKDEVVDVAAPAAAPVAAPARAPVADVPSEAPRLRTMWRLFGDEPSAAADADGEEAEAEAEAEVALPWRDRVVQQMNYQDTMSLMSFAHQVHIAYYVQIAAVHSSSSPCG